MPQLKFDYGMELQGFAPSLDLRVFQIGPSGEMGFFPARTSSDVCRELGWLCSRPLEVAEAEAMRNGYKPAEDIVMTSFDLGGVTVTEENLRDPASLPILAGWRWYRDPSISMADAIAKGGEPECSVLDAVNIALARSGAPIAATEYAKLFMRVNFNDDEVPRSPEDTLKIGDIIKQFLVHNEVVPYFLLGVKEREGLWDGAYGSSLYLACEALESLLLALDNEALEELVLSIEGGKLEELRAGGVEWLEKLLNFIPEGAIRGFIVPSIAGMAPDAEYLPEAYDDEDVEGDSSDDESDGSGDTGDHREAGGSFSGGRLAKGGVADQGAYSFLTDESLSGIKSVLEDISADDISDICDSCASMFEVISSDLRERIAHDADEKFIGSVLYELLIKLSDSFLSLTETSSGKDLRRVCHGLHAVWVELINLHQVTVHELDPSTNGKTLWISVIEFLRPIKDIMDSVLSYVQSRDIAWKQCRYGVADARARMSRSLRRHTPAADAQSIMSGESARGKGVYH